MLPQGRALQLEEMVSVKPGHAKALGRRTISSRGSADAHIS